MSVEEFHRLTLREGQIVRSVTRAFGPDAKTFTVQVDPPYVAPEAGDCR